MVEARIWAVAIFVPAKPSPVQRGAASGLPPIRKALGAVSQRPRPDRDYAGKPNTSRRVCRTQHGAG